VRGDAQVTWPRGAGCVGFALQGMLPAVEIDDEPSLVTDEIDDELA